MPYLMKILYNGSKLDNLIPLGTVARLIQVAAAEVGYIEKPENLTKYGEFMKADGLPWCGSFVNWCFSQAGIKLPSMVATAIGAHRLKEVGRFHTDKPEVGDIAFMDFPHDGIDRISHVGIVASVHSNSVTTIEGNTGGENKDQRNGGMVLVKERKLGDGSPIVGFGRVRFVAYVGEIPLVEVTAPKPKRKVIKK